jgi:hypothetical protein
MHAVVLLCLGVLYGAEPTVPPANPTEDALASARTRVHDETEKHLRRMAIIDRIEVIAEDKRKDRLAENAQELRNREVLRHQTAMDAIAQDIGMKRKEDEKQVEKQRKKDEKKQ